jgi:hypothetical protein
MSDVWQMRRDTAASFTDANTLLAQGEEAYELDTGLMKRGDGVTLWNDLDYLTIGSGAFGNIDGGAPDSIYTIPPMDGGGP